MSRRPVGNGEDRGRFITRELCSSWLISPIARRTLRLEVNGANTVESPGERLKVFISYARADGAALAEDLVTGLELAGISRLFSTGATSPPPKTGRPGLAR